MRRLSVIIRKLITNYCNEIAKINHKPINNTKREVDGSKILLIWLLYDYEGNSWFLNGSENQTHEIQMTDKWQTHDIEYRDENLTSKLKSDNIYKGTVVNFLLKSCYLIAEDNKSVKEKETS